MVVVLRGDVHLGGNHVELEVILAVMVISAAVILGELGGNRTGLLGGGFQTNRAGLGALMTSFAYSAMPFPVSCLQYESIFGSRAMRSASSSG